QYAIEDDITTLRLRAIRILRSKQISTGKIGRTLTAKYLASQRSTRRCSARVRNQFAGLLIRSHPQALVFTTAWVPVLVEFSLLARAPVTAAPVPPSQERAACACTRGWALPNRAGLQPLLHHIRAAAFGTFLAHRLAPSYELAIGVTVATIKRLALLGAALDNLAIGTLRTLHPDGFLLDVLAGGIVAARRELTKASMLQHQVVVALRTLFVERLVGFLLLSADRLGGLAIRVSRACVEGPEAALL